MASKHWKTEDIRKQVSVTDAPTRNTDHVAELQVFTAAANSVGVGSRQIQEVAQVANKESNLCSRGRVANKRKGQDMTHILKKGHADTKSEYSTLKTVRKGLHNVSTAGCSPKTKQVVSSARKTLRTADQRTSSNIKRRKMNR